MAVGLPKDKANIDAILGEATRETNRRMRMNAQLAGELSAYTDPQYTAVGYTAGEITAIRNAATRLAEIASLYRGTATLASAHDFQPDLRPLFGVLGDY